VPGVDRGEASAAVLTVTTSFVGPTDVTNQTITVSQFNPALGALLGVTIRLDANMSTEASVTSDGDFLLAWDKDTYSLLLDGSSIFGPARRPAHPACSWTPRPARSTQVSGPCRSC
jgi:hypothetical protein